MERIAQLEAVRVTVLDPITGARAPAAVWGQMCVIPNNKGAFLLARRDPNRQGAFRNLDFHTLAVQNGVNASPPGPQLVQVLDEELGIFRVETQASPFGTDGTLIPCLLTSEGGTLQVPTGDISKQDEAPIGVGIHIESGTNGIVLARRLKSKIMMTVTPAAPNNNRRFAYKVVEASRIKEQFRTEFSIAEGKGPELELYVPPSELTARYAWQSDAEAKAVLVELLGLNTDNPEEAGIQALELPGYVLANATEIDGHATAVAAEAMAAYADSVMGRVTTRAHDKGTRLVGNMSGVALQVSAAPSAKVQMTHEFPGFAKPISRMALLPESVRHLVFGILDPGISKA
jgi:hypothetical protein